MALLRYCTRRWPAAVALLAAVVVWASPAGAQVLTQDQALSMAFPDADEIQRRTAYLEDHQVERVRELAGGRVDVPSTVVTHYVAMDGGEPVGVAYFDVHRVRTLEEVLMVVVDRNHRIRRLETVSFREPPEYEAPDGWLDRFHGRALSPELSLKGEIPAMTGATLTARAVTEAARRVLAVHRVVRPFEGMGAPVR